MINEYKSLRAIYDETYKEELSREMRKEAKEIKEGECD